MKVLQVVPGSIWAGMERQVVALCDGLRAAGVDVRAALWHDRETASALKSLGVTVVILPPGRRGAEAIPYLRDYLNREGVDIVHSHGYKANYVAWQAALNTGVKLVRTEHGMPEPFRGWNALKMRFYLRLDRKAAAAANRVIYVSHDLKQRLNLPVPDERTAVWHNVLPEQIAPLSREAARAELELEPDATIIGAAGRLVPVKDFSTFIDVSVRLEDQARFVLFGDGPERVNLQQENRRKGGTVEFAGFRSDFPRLLPALDIFLFTSRDEGLPTALLEALACGVPVVAPPVGGIPEVLTGGLEIGLARDRSVTSLVAACRRFFTEPELREPYVAEARKRAAEFTPERLGRQAQALYAELLA